MRRGPSFTVEVPAEENYLSAITRFQEAQTQQFRATHAWIREPTQRASGPMAVQLGLNGALFAQAIKLTFEAPENELSERDKVLTITSLYFGSKHNPIDYFQQALPGARFSPIEDRPGVLEEFIEDCLEHGDTGSLVKQVARAFDENTNHTYKDLAAAVSRTPRARRLAKRERAKKKALHVGEIAAIALATNVASNVARRGFSRLRSSET